MSTFKENSKGKPRMRRLWGTWAYARKNQHNDIKRRCCFSCIELKHTVDFNVSPEHNSTATGKQQALE